MNIKRLSFREIPTEPPPVGALNTGGVWNFRDFQATTRYISQI